MILPSVSLCGAGVMAILEVFVDVDVAGVWVVVEVPAVTVSLFFIES